MAIDPFAPAADEANTETVTTPEVVVAQNVDHEAITTTFKAGAGYDAPWIVTRAATIAEADALLDQSFADYMAKVKRVATAFSGETNMKPKAAAAPAAKPAYQQPPAGSPECPEGWTYKSGVGKNGKTWSAYMPPRGVTADPIWL